MGVSSTRDASLGFWGEPLSPPRPSGSNQVPVGARGRLREKENSRRLGWERGASRARLGLAAPPLPSRAPPAVCPAGSFFAASERGRALRGGSGLPAPHPIPGSGHKSPAAACRIPAWSSLRSAKRRGLSDRLPAPPPLHPARGAGRTAGGHTAARAPRRYLLPCYEGSPGEPTRAGGKACCAWGCRRRRYRHRACLKLPKVESQLEAAARREREGKELRRCRRDTHIDRRADHRKTQPWLPIPGAPEASQLRSLVGG